MNKSDIGSIFSLITTLTILVASFFQWWNITYGGKMITKKWVKVLFCICILFTIISVLLLIF